MNVLVDALNGRNIEDNVVNEENPILQPVGGEMNHLQFHQQKKWKLVQWGEFLKITLLAGLGLGLIGAVSKLKRKKSSKRII